jgi:LPS-assembly protein
MAGPCVRICRRLVLVLVAVLGGIPLSLPATANQGTAAGPSSGSLPLDVTADRIQYQQTQDVYEAEGSVVVQQGSLKLTADRASIQALPGIVTATGHVHLTDPQTDLTAERLELNVNTEAGVVTHGQLFLPRRNSLVTGRLLQRFSEYHYRVKDGSFTNCDAQDGEVPAWRIRAKDLDLTVADSVAFKEAWFCVNDVPAIPLPALSYPLATRKTGFLAPFVGYDNRFGFHAEETFYWAINPSQDLTITPKYFSQLGYGSDFVYRYVLDRRSRGQWKVDYLQQTELPNVSGVTDTGQDPRKARAAFSGGHTQKVGETLVIRANANLVTDPNYFQQLSNSGVLRALPSAESNFLTTQQLSYGALYLLGRYLQPLQAGGQDTFQRLPEAGYLLPNVSLFNSPLLFGMEGNYVNFFREEEFTFNRVTAVPGIETDVVNLGHVVGIRPQAKFLEAYYTRGVQSDDSQHRETFWLGVDATSKLTRRFGLQDGGSFLHTIEPSVTYEYVPKTDQSDLLQIDQMDDLPRKNLLTYALRSRVLEQGKNSVFSWLDLTLAQSYHVGAIQTVARDFSPGVIPPFGSSTQPLQPATVPIQGKRFSDVWVRAVIGNIQTQATRSQMDVSQFERGGGRLTWQRPPINRYLTIDAFFDPYSGSVSQFNTDLRFQESTNWYVQVGQRFSRDGNRVRRGDIWNPISFNEVYAPTEEIQFVTAAGGFRTPWGWTIGAKGYFDVKSGKSPEFDVVGLYQNPCKCWSVGVYFVQFPGRYQYALMLNLTGIGWNENAGTAVMQSLLSPLLWGERGLPWYTPFGPYGRSQYGRPQQVTSGDRESFGTQ